MIPIVIASVMKPADEVRMYKRISTSLAKTNKYEINIIGIDSKSQGLANPNIRFHKLSHPGRSIFSRLAKLIKVQKLITEIRPQLVIVTSPDLLYMITHHRDKKHFKVIYDVQEDYYKNIIFQRVYPLWIKHLLATTIRVVEVRAAQKASYLWLAEQTYLKDIPFCSKHPHALILENKYHNENPQQSKGPTEGIKLLFTGTISTYSGIHHALKIYHTLAAYDEKISIVIAGICHDNRLAHELLMRAKADANITLIGIKQFVPHDKIVEQIVSSNIAIIGYQPNAISKDKFPSKLFEYIAHRLPTIVERDTRWAQELSQHQLDIPVHLEEPSASSILERYQEISQSTNLQSVDPHLWKQYDEVVTKCINTLV